MRVQEDTTVIFCPILSCPKSLGVATIPRPTCQYHKLIVILTPIRQHNLSKHPEILRKEGRSTSSFYLPRLTDAVDVDVVGTEIIGPGSTTIRDDGAILKHGLDGRWLPLRE